jgi:hypothetical protein
LAVPDVFDSAGAQLSRLRGTSTRLGRTLDGLGDHIRFVNLYVHLAIRLSWAGMHWHAVVLAVAAGVFHSFQSSAVDFIRNAYVAIGEGRGEVDLVEDLPAATEGSVAERFAAWAYDGYVRRQLWMFPRTVELLRMLRRNGVAESFRAAYRDRQQPLLPLCAWLGQNIRFALLGVAAVGGCPSFDRWTEVLWMSRVLVSVLLPRHEHNSAALQSALEPEASVY